MILRKINISREELNRLYTLNKLTTYEIARRFNCTNSCVSFWLKKQNIPRRDSKLKQGSTLYKLRGPIWNKGLTKKNNETLQKQSERMSNLEDYESPAWKGGIKKESRGYLLIHKPYHPDADKQGYVREHRLIMEKKLGRYLKKEEVIHHINGIKSDNRINNLQLFESSKEHKRFHALKNGGNFKQFPNFIKLGELKSYMKSEEWKKMREKALKRDNYICQKCKRIDIKLKVHHKIPYAISRNHDINNLITLCQGCHNHEEYAFYKGAIV